MTEETELERLLRKDADVFALTLMVVAEARGCHPSEIIEDVLLNAIARLQESGLVSASMAGDDE